MLQVTNITKQFNGRNVLHRLSFEVQKGDFVVIMGNNGAGKSTLFDIISGRLFPDEGEIFFNSLNVTSFSEQQRAFYVGRLLQNTLLSTCSSMTVRENFAMTMLKNRRATLFKGIDAFHAHALEDLSKRFSCTKFPWTNYLDIPMGNLSGGQRQILACMMALLHKPQILFLDEPTAALDPISATELLSFISAFAKEQLLATLLISHDPFIAKHMGNRLWILDAGSIKKEFGKEKKELSPSDFFSHIDYARI